MVRTIGYLLIIILMNISDVNSSPLEPQSNTNNEPLIFGLLPHNPPPSLVYISIVISFFMFIWAIITFTVARMDRRASKRLSVEDEYWFRKILMPVCIEPLILFVIEKSEVLRNIATKHQRSELHFKREEYDRFLSEFKAEKNAVMSRFMVLGAISKELYKISSEQIDKIDDIVTKHCALNSITEDNVEDIRYAKHSVVAQEISSILDSIVSEFIKKHKELF